MRARRHVATRDDDGARRRARRPSGMSSDDAPTFDALETRRACRALLPTLDLERATERSVREAVRDALRAARGDDGRDVDRIVVQNEIDAFLGRADAAVAANEDGARGATTTATTKRERVDDEGSPTIGGNKRASATAEESALDETRVLAALEAIGEDGTEAKALASFLKRDKTAVNKALYAMAARGTARREDGEGGAPRWFVANARVGASEAATTQSARPASSTADAATTDAATSAGGDDAVENEVVALSKTKRVTVRKWKETTLVDIREYYQAGGEGPYKPGKKGISLSSAQWRVLDANIDKVASAIEACEASSQEQLVCEMSNTRRCTVSKYKGKVLVNIREYYEKDGEMRPGMKGASLAVEAARRLVAHASQISARVASLE
jgi:hypothetical protein